MNKLKYHLARPFALPTALLLFLTLGADHNDSSRAAGETPAVEDISLAARQPLREDSPAIVTAPVFRNSLLNVDTPSSPNDWCPTGTDWASYRLLAPAIG